MLRVFFPGLYSDKCDAHLDLPHLSAVYTALRKAIRFVDLASSYRWSPSYQSAIDKAKKGNSNILQFTTHAVAVENANPFLRAFEGYLMDHHDWAFDMVYQVQVQGVKDLYQHNCTSAEADGQLERLMAPFNPAMGKWWIDVGLEIMAEDAVLQWRTSSHATVLAYVLNIPEENANRACHLSNRSYHRDMSAHLPDLSGYRVALKRNQGGAVGSIFNQEYGSDKNLTAHKSQHGSAKILTGHQAVQGSPPKVVGQMYDMFQDAGDSLSCSARIEHRVPLDNERGVFMSPLPAWVLNASLLVFEVADWWYVHLSPCFLICIGRLRGEWHLGDGDLSGFMP